MEIMVVVCVIAILAAVIVPNLLRARLSTFEAITVQNLKTLQKALEMYRAVHDGYPDDWQADMYPGIGPAFGPPSFNVNIQDPAWVTLQGYQYQYQGQPPGCVEPVGCGSYLLWARPKTLNRTGSRSFITGVEIELRHCLAASSDDLADSDDALIGVEPSAC